MKTPTLAPVYLDNEPVSLMGDPRPQVSKVVAATGKHPEKFDIKLLHSETDSEGKTVELDYVIDRTEEPAKPIYLTTVEKEGIGSTDIESSFGSGPSNLGSGGMGGSSYNKGGPSSATLPKGGSASGNQGYGSGSGKPQNQGTSTQNQGAQGAFSQPMKGGIGSSSQTAQGKTQKPAEWPVQGKKEPEQGPADDDIE